MGGSMFGPHRREQIEFLGKFGDAKLGCLKKGLGHIKELHFRETNAKVYLDRTSVRGSAFLAEISQAWLGCSKAEPRRSKPMHFNEKAEKTLENWMGGSVFGLHRRERVAFYVKFGGARLGRVKEGVGRNKNQHFHEKMEKWTWRMRVCMEQA